MAPVIPFIPLIAAGIGAAGGVGAAAISAHKKPGTPAKPAASPLLADPAAASGAPKGIIPGSLNNPLGDTTNPSLSRNKLLGN